MAYMAIIATWILVALLQQCSGFPSTLTLERVVQLNRPTNLTQLMSQDRARHRRMWPSGGVANFSMGALRDSPTAVGIYYTRVQLGTPSKEFLLIFDTGSYISWINCASCQTCSRAIRNVTYDPRSSDTSFFVPCDKKCKSEREGSFCSAGDNLCHYSVSYLDTSETTGFYVKDLLNYESVLGKKTFRSTAPFIFGCSTTTIEVMQRIPLDGLLGLGRQSVSIISQLASQGLTPMAFSHCLSGDGNGGGSLILGEVTAPNMSYSPIIPSDPHYSLKVEFVSVNGKKLDIDPKVFSGTTNQGAGIDSGTTYAYLPTKAYNAFVEAVDAIVSSYAQVVTYRDFHCYRLTSRAVTTIFPQVSFNLQGGAALIIGPPDYLLEMGPMGGATMWCIAFHKDDRVTVFGDIVLRNKIIVYDLAGQRIGWTNYNCSAPLNVSTVVTRRRSDATRTSFRPDHMVSMLASNILVFILLSAYPI